MKANILFRPSELGKLMGSARGKSNLEKYEDIKAQFDKVLDEYNALENQETKKAFGLKERMTKYLGQLEALEDSKHLPHLPETCKKQLKAKMIEIKYDRYKEISNKYITKGNDCEEAAITLYSLIKGKLFENNKKRIRNEYLSGEIDLEWRDELNSLYRITDIKNSYSIHSFFDNIDTIKSDNKWQGVGYLALHPTVKSYSIANVLVDNTDDAILLELHRESYKWKGGDTPAWREIEMIKEHIYTKKRFEQFVEMRGCVPLDQQSINAYNSFKELPQDERLIEHTFERNEEDIEKVYNRLDECRKYLEITFDIKHSIDEVNV